ncbi:hypothetical protein [Verrucomicrobium sp. 3C]|nr:hypothetical protein [Verrucomicrobium sp. 3C]
MSADSPGDSYSPIREAMRVALLACAVSGKLGVQENGTAPSRTHR